MNLLDKGYITISSTGPTDANTSNVTKDENNVVIMVVVVLMMMAKLKMMIVMAVIRLTMMRTIMMKI